MPDEASSGPTAAQLQAAGLVAITEVNNYPLRSYNSAARNFPPETAYISSKWNTPPVVDYTVTFNSEGGTAVASETVVAGVSIAAPVAPTQSGYTFNGWFLSPTNTMEVVEFPYTPTGNVTLYAAWAAVVVPPPASYLPEVGSNTAMIDYGIYPTQLVACQSIGMTWIRDNAPWNFTDGSFTGIESAAGYSVANAQIIAARVATYRTYGLKPIIVITTQGNPGLDSTWTPARFAKMMAWLVAQPGLQGIDWELFNEPDSQGGGIPAALVAQAYALAYPAMKVADPTCVVHGIVSLSFAPAGYWNGTDFVVSLVAALKTLNATLSEVMDRASFHMYFPNAANSARDASPLVAGFWNKTPTQLITAMLALLAANGFTKGIDITECGWQSQNDGTMTPAQQGQWYQDLFGTVLPPFAKSIGVVCQYQISDSGDYYGIMGEPAQAILTSIVKGT